MFFISKLIVTLLRLKVLTLRAFFPVKKNDHKRPAIYEIVKHLGLNTRLVVLIQLLYCTKIIKRASSWISREAPQGFGLEASTRRLGVGTVTLHAEKCNMNYWNLGETWDDTHAS